MFDGMLSRDDYEPQGVSAPAASAWSWRLVALIGAMTSLWIVAAFMFPDVVSNLGPQF
jgi:hypothetical protein